MVMDTKMVMVVMLVDMEKVKTTAEGTERRTITTLTSEVAKVDRTTTTRDIALQTKTLTMAIVVMVIRVVDIMVRINTTISIVTNLCSIKILPCTNPANSNPCTTSKTSSTPVMDTRTNTTPTTSRSLHLVSRCPCHNKCNISQKRFRVMDRVTILLPNPITLIDLIRITTTTISERRKKD